MAVEVANAVLTNVSAMLTKISHDTVAHGKSEHVPGGWFHEIIHSTAHCIDCLGLLMIVVAIVSILPSVMLKIIPGMIFNSEDSKVVKANHDAWLRARLQFSRGLILGMDFMVAADVVETLMSEIDLLKLVSIIAMRSWLGYERSKEFESLEHEAKLVEEEEQRGRGVGSVATTSSKKDS